VYYILLLQAGCGAGLRLLLNLFSLSLRAFRLSG